METAALLERAARDARTAAMVLADAGRTRWQGVNADRYRVELAGARAAVAAVEHALEAQARDAAARVTP